MKQLIFLMLMLLVGAFAFGSVPIVKTGVKDKKEKCCRDVAESVTIIQVNDVGKEIELDKDGDLSKRPPITKRFWTTSLDKYSDINDYAYNILLKMHSIKHSKVDYIIKIC